MAWNLVASTTSRGGNASPSVDTTGADLIVIAAIGFAGVTAPHDSKSNTFTALSERTGSQCKVRIYYVVSPSVGSGHTCTANTAGQFAVGFIYAFSGCNTADAFDQESAGGGTASGTSLQPGSVTPDEDNCLIVSGLSFFNSTGATINGGYTGAAVDTDGSTHISGGGAYLVQTSAAATNPTWSWAGNADAAAASAVFHGTGGGGPTGQPSRKRMSGVELVSQRVLGGGGVKMWRAMPSEREITHMKALAKRAA